MKKILAMVMIIALVMSLSIPAAAQDVKNSDSDYYEHEETGVSIPYRLVLPEVYDEKYIFPLVVFFHGAGERGYENERQLDIGVQQIADNMPKAIILVPQCTHGNQWVDTPWSEGGYSVDAVEESDELIAVMDLVAQIKEEYSVDDDRVYAAGVSMGGFAVWDVMVRHNDVFAAGVAVCGAGDPTKAEVLKDTPMFVFHGGQDETVPVSGSTNMVEAIEAAGGTKVQYTEYGEAGHGIWGQVFQIEKLYKDLQRCKLSDRYTPAEEPESQQPQPILQLLPYILIGTVVVLAVVFVLVLAGGKKKKNDDKEQAC